MSIETNKKFISLLKPDGNYQYSISILFLLIGIISDFSLIYIIFMISQPFASYTDSDGIAQFGKLSYSICNSHISNISINTELSNNNLSLLLNIFCSKLKASVLIMIYLLGMLIGYVLLSFIGYVNKENLLKALIIILFLSNWISFTENYIGFCVMLFLQGFSHISIYLTKLSIISSITIIQSNRFIIIQYFSGILSGSICGFIYTSNIDFRFLYGGLSILLFILLIIVHFILIPNPIYFLYNNQINETIKSSIRIASFNNRIKKIDRESESENDIEEQLSSDKILSNSQYQFTEEYLKVWILTAYVKSEDENENENDVEVNENNTENVENENENDINKENINAEPDFHIKNEIFLCILTIFIYILININIFEVHFYANTSYFELWYLISMMLTALLYIIWIILYKSMIDLKYCIIFPLLLVISIRIIDAVDLIQDKYLFFFQRSISNSMQLPLNLLLAKNYIFPNRITIYNIIGYTVHIIISFSPFIVHYLIFFYINIIYVMIACLSLVSLIFIDNQSKSVLNKSKVEIK